LIKKIQNKLSQDANLNELLSGSVVTFLLKVAGMMLGYLVMLYISRKFGAKGAGLYTLVTNLLNVIAVIAGVGLHVAVLRYVGQVKNNVKLMRKLYKYILQIVFPTTVLIGLLLYFLAEKIAVDFLENEMYLSAFKIGAFVLPFFTINLIQIEYIRGLKKLKISEYLRSINRPLVIICMLILISSSYGAMAAIYAFIGSIILSFLISSIYIYRKLYYNHDRTESAVLPSSSFSRVDLIKTGFPMMLTSMSTFIIGSAGSIFLERFGETDQVGIFNICLRLAQFVSFVLVVVNTITGPKFAELYWGNEMLDLQKLIRQSSKLIFLISAGVSFLLVLFSNHILGFFGSEFTIGKSTFILLILGQLVNASTGCVGIFLNMSGNQKVLRNIMALTALFSVLGYFILVPIYGMEGAAFISMLGSIIVNIFSVLYTKYKLGVNTFYIPFYK
jgi:O-antigen/teichoic acid export membrane protein